MTNLRWSFAGIWNKSLENRPERKLEPRNRIWASELGGSYLDRYYKMKGIAPTNPPNARALRKFEAGNLMEWVVEMVLKRAGILIDKQKWLGYQYPGLLEVSGKLDQLAGGKIDWAKAKAEVVSLELPEFFNRATDAIIDHLASKYPNGLAEVVIEVKSSSSFKFDRYEIVGADLNHQLQIFHYLKSSGMEEGHLVYICKDDLRMLEFGVTNPSPLEEIYRKDIEKISGYVARNEEPPAEAEVLFDTGTLKFSKNWKVEYSNYLTKIYKYKEPEDYRIRWDRDVAQFNRVFARIVLGKNMTALNLEVIEKIKAYFPEFEDYVVLAKKNKDLIEEEVEENGMD